MKQEPFGALPGGQQPTIFTLSNANGIELRLTDFGGIVQSLEVPDRHGDLADVVLGYDDLEGFAQDTEYFGSLIGRVGNRISEARFELDGEVFQLRPNLGTDQLHGGPSGGFAKVLWAATPFESGERQGVHLLYQSPEGEEQYPGNLSVEVRFTLNHDNELILDYLAVTDRATPLNLTHHCYFNLGSSKDVLEHELWIQAEEYLPVSDRLIPTGEFRAVAGTPFDFRSPRSIGERITADDEQLQLAGGYDHTFVLDRAAPGVAAGGTAETRLVARVQEPQSGRVMEVETSEPGVQFYSGNSLHPGIVGKGGRAYTQHAGLCLETQHFPDAPNRPEFPSIILPPGVEYRSRTVYRFGTDG